MSNTLLRFGMSEKAFEVIQRLLSLDGRLRAERQVLLLVNVAVEPELRLETIDRLGLGLENEIRVVTAAQIAGGIAEIAAIHLLDLLDLGALFFKFAFETFDDVLGSVFAALDVED